MTIEEFKAYYGNGYQFSRRTGLGATSFHSWVARGYIPIASQVRLEKITDGGLRARFEDVLNVELDGD